MQTVYNRHIKTVMKFDLDTEKRLIYGHILFFLMRQQNIKSAILLQLCWTVSLGNECLCNVED